MTIPSADVERTELALSDNTGGMQNGRVTLESSMAVSYEGKHPLIICDAVFPLLGMKWIHESTEKPESLKLPYYNIQSLKTT